LKKRSKKLLDIGLSFTTGARASVQKFFGSFFQKRTCLLLALPLTIAADIAAEQATVAILPPDDGYRLYIPDISFAHMADGHASVIDGHDFKFLGNLPIGFSGQIAASANRSKIYIATTYYDRGNRGHRTDVLEIYDARKLAFEREVVVPAKHVEGVPYNAYLVPSVHDRIVLLQNATPAASVTIVDPAAGKVLAELPTAGCFGIYPSPTDELVFSTLCGDGSAVTIGMDASGHERFRHRSAKFFDPVNDPVYIEAGTLGSKLVLLSFKGNVHIIDISGDTAVQNTVWSLTGADDTKGWAPGGYQPFAVHAASGQIFVGMHANAFEGSHKYPAQEIWQADLKTGHILRRVPASGAIALAITQDASPVLFALIRDDASLQAFDVGAGFRLLGHSAPVVDSPSTMKLE
jgi:methylamine dehydrogenase heavy chain